MELKNHPDKVGRGDTVTLPPHSIKIDPAHNIRDMTSERTRAHIEELKISIRAFGGIKDPFEVRMVGEDAFVTDGECRLTAVLEMMHEEHFKCEGIKCVKEAGGTDEEERLLNFGVSGTKERYTELELAEWCRRCDRRGISHDKIAAAAGWKSKASVAGHLKILSDMPSDIQGMVRREEVSATEAMKEVRANGAEIATETLKEAKTIADREGKTKITRKTIDKTKTGAMRPRQAAMPIQASPDIQRAINVCGDLTKIAVVKGVAGKAGDDMVEVPASLIIAAREAFENAPAFKQLSHESASPTELTTDEKHARAASLADARQREADEIQALREAPAPQTSPDTGPKLRDLYDALDSLAKASRNQIKDIELESPSWNIAELVEAVEHAERIIEKVNLGNVTLPAE